MKFTRTIDGQLVELFGGTRGCTISVNGSAHLTLPDREALAWLVKHLGLCHSAIVKGEIHAYAQARSEEAA